MSEMQVEPQVVLPASLTTRLDRLADIMTAWQAALVASSVRPKYVPNLPCQTVVADANGFALLVWPTIPAGREWHIRQVVVGGLNMTTTAAGKATLFSDSNQNPIDMAVPLYNVRDSTIASASSLPNISFYDHGEFVIKGGEALQCQITSGTSGQQYCAATSFEDWPLGAGGEMY